MGRAKKSAYKAVQGLWYAVTKDGEVLPRTSATNADNAMEKYCEVYGVESWGKATEQGMLCKCLDQSFTDHIKE